jgi:hypothetical protein
VPDPGSNLSQRLQWRHQPLCGQQRFNRLAHGTAVHGRRQPDGCRIAHHPDLHARRQKYIACPLNAGSETPVGVQRCLCLVHRASDERRQGLRLGRGRHQHGTDLAQVHQAAVALRALKLAGKDNGPGACGCQSVDQLRIHIARPRPGANGCETGLVDRHDGYLAQGLATGSGGGSIQKLLVQRINQTGEKLQARHGKRQRQGPSPAPVPPHFWHCSTQPTAHCPPPWFYRDTPASKKSA